MTPKNNKTTKKVSKSGRGGRIVICVPKEYIGKEVEIIVNFPNENKTGNWRDIVKKANE